MTKRMEADLNNSRLKNIEKKLNVNSIKVVVCFSGSEGCLLSSANGVKIGKLFKGIEEVQSLYRKTDALIINMSGFADLDIKQLKSNEMAGLQNVEVDIRREQGSGYAYEDFIRENNAKAELLKVLGEQGYPIT